jgi:hypothetical protein|tara:strand:- start:140 stop:505 length:366 start_codon:yes stop_codon:yes gene_type:complete
MLDTRNGFGKRCELIAAEWLLSQNCYVYSPFVEQGPVDLIALAPGHQWFFFDVKKVGRRKDGSIISRTLTSRQLSLGIRLLYVDIETKRVELHPHQFSTKPFSETDPTTSSLLRSMTHSPD